MTASTVIPEALEETLLEMSGALNPDTKRRWELRELAAWLKSAHGLTVSHMAVWRCLSKLRRARAALTREVLRERLLDTLEFDWENLDALAATIIEKADGMRDDKNPKGFLACVSELRKIAATKARIATGTDDDEKVTVSGNASSLAEFLGSAFGKSPAGPMGE